LRNGSKIVLSKVEYGTNSGLVGGITLMEKVRKYFGAIEIDTGRSR